MNATSVVSTVQAESRGREQECLEKFGEDLRQPMACAYGYAEMLLTRDFSADMQRDLHAALLMQLDAVRDVMERYAPTKEGPRP